MTNVLIALDIFRGQPTHDPVSIQEWVNLIYTDSVHVKNIYEKCVVTHAMFYILASARMSIDVRPV